MIDTTQLPSTLPSEHQALLQRIIDTLSVDQRIQGIGISGSYTTNTMDEFSDLDLVIAVTDSEFEQVMAQRFEIINTIDGNIAAFTGEHVGEPRLVVTLFEPGTLHVDFKFVALSDAANRVDDTQVLWERDTLLTDVLASKGYQFPQPDPQWIEDRFWVWIHYASTKIARGEYFEAMETLAFLRTSVLSPLALKQARLTPSGVRKIEQLLPEFCEQLKETVAMPNQASLVLGYEACIVLYLHLRANETVNENRKAQIAAIEYFEKYAKHD